MVCIVCVLRVALYDRTQSYMGSSQRVCLVLGDKYEVSCDRENKNELGVWS